MGPCGLRCVAASCRAGEHAPVGTPLLPKPVHRPSAGYLRCVRARTAWCKAAVWLGHGGRCRYTGGMSRVIAANEYRRERWRNGLGRSEEHTSELQSLMRISYAVFCLKKKKTKT